MDNLSQEEIEALLNGQTSNSEEQTPVQEPEENGLTDGDEQKQTQAPPEPTPVNSAVFEELNMESVETPIAPDLELLMDVPLSLTVELGKTRCYVKDLLNLTTGSIVELDRLAGDPIDILINGKLFAKGEVVVIDENFGVRIKEILNKKNDSAKQNSK